MTGHSAARIGAGFGVLLLLSACAGELNPGITTASITAPPADERPQDEPVALGKMHYARGEYGSAEKSFRQAVEANPGSAEAWLGLAASYDRLHRFDLAEKAYRQVLAKVGRTVPVLNNLAYHHMLRGDLAQARKLLDEAQRMEPGNPVVLGNIKLLENWNSGDARSRG